MKTRILLVHPKHENVVDKILFISGLKNTKTKEKGQFRYRVKIKSRHDYNKLKRAEEYASFPNRKLFVEFVTSFFPDGHLLIDSPDKIEWNCYFWTGLEVRKFQFTQSLKGLNRQIVRKKIKKEYKGMVNNEVL